MRIPTLIALVLGLAVPLSAAGERFIDTFEGGSLEPGWTVDAAPSATVTVADGALRIAAPLNAYAHIERPLGTDNVTASARVRPGDPAGVSWACGVFLYWAEDVWAMLAVVDHGGGMIYTAERTGERLPLEAPLMPCDRLSYTWLRVQLGEDCIRYFTRRAGERGWAVARVIERPAEMAGPPRLLIVGKGFGGPGREPGEDYPAPDLDNSYADLGPMSEALVEGVMVEPTPRSLLRLQPGEARAMGDADGAAILDLPGDPTYEQVAALYPPMRHVREAVGVKGHPDEVGINEWGALEFPGVLGRWLIGEARAPFGEGPSRPAKRLLEGHLPVVIAEWEHEGRRWEQTVAAWSEGMSPDAPATATVRLKLLSGEPAEVAFELPAGSGQRLATAHVSRSEPAHLTVSLAEPSAAQIIDAAGFETALAEVRDFWREDLSRGMQIRVPDARMMDAHRAWLAYNGINVDKVGEYLEPHDGSHFYEEVYGYSAARYAQVLDQWGRHEEAEAYLSTLMAAQTEDGLLSWNFGLTDTGALLIALAEHYRMTDDVTWWQEVAPAAVRACDWLIRARDEERAAGSAGKPRVVRGLIQFRSYCDYPTPVYGYLHNAYCADGMGRVGAILADAGLPNEADRISREAERYRRDVLASMDAATLDINGRSVIPLEPDTQRLLRDSGHRSTDYYGLVASTMLECDVPPRGSPQAESYETFLREHGGIQLGTAEFMGGIDHAYGLGYMLRRLRAGYPEEYILGVWTALAYGMTRETFSSVEVTMHKTGENYMTLPHLYSGTQQLMMLRAMLVDEYDGEVHLLSGVPRHWLEEGKVIEVEGAATADGPLSLRLESSVAADEIRVAVDPPCRSTPQALILHLRHPEGRMIRGVSLNGSPWRRFEGERIVLPVDGQPIRLVARY